MANSEAENVGRITSEAHGRILEVTIDNQTKRNSFSPQMMEELSNARHIPGPESRR